MSVGVWPDDGSPRDERPLWVQYAVSEAEVRAFEATGADPFAVREACECVNHGYDARRVLLALKRGHRSRRDIGRMCASYPR